MIAILVYIIFFFIGLISPIPKKFLISAYVLSILFDENRILNISISNVLSILLISRLIIKKNKNWFSFSYPVFFLVIFLLISFISFLLTPNEGANSNMISIFLLVLNSILLARYIAKKNLIKFLIRIVLTLSILSALTVIFDASLYYFFGIQMQSVGVYALRNLNMYAYSAIGLFSGNGIASLHILPGLIIVLFNSSISRYKNLIFLVLVLGLVSTMSRGMILVFIMFFLSSFYINRKNNSKIIKYFSYSLIPFIIIGSANLVVFMSNFNLTSVASRFYLISASFIKISEKPFFGNGLNARIVGNKLDLDFLDKSQIQEWELNDNLRETHNTLLQIPLETGLIGFFFFGLMYFFILKQSYITYKFSTKVGIDNNLSLCVFLLLGMLIIASLANSYMYFKLLWIIITIGIAFYSITKFNYEIK